MALQEALIKNSTELLSFTKSHNARGVHAENQTKTNAAPWNPNDTFCTNKVSLLKSEWNFKGSWKPKQSWKVSIKLQDSYLFPYFQTLLQSCSNHSLMYSGASRHGQRNTTQRPNWALVHTIKWFLTKVPRSFSQGKRQSSQEIVLEIPHINM